MYSFSSPSSRRHHLHDSRDTLPADVSQWLQWVEGPTSALTRHYFCQVIAQLTPPPRERIVQVKLVLAGLIRHVSNEKEATNLGQSRESSQSYLLICSDCKEHDGEVGVVSKLHIWWHLVRPIWTY